MGKTWVPLESNPDVLNQYISSLGVDPSTANFNDVYGLDEDMLAMVPQPVRAVIMCFPISAEVDAAAKNGEVKELLAGDLHTCVPGHRPEDEKIAASGHVAPPSLFYMKQTIGNACGTIAILHSVCNNTHHLQIAEDSFVSKFLSATQDMDAAQRGKFLEDPPAGAPDIEAAHQAAAAEGDTAPPPEDEDVNLHFVAFINKDGTLYELDGRRKGPVPHGPTTDDTLLKDSSAVIQQLISKTPSLNFSLLALSGC